jgi:hypothetical protein
MNIITRWSLLALVSACGGLNATKPVSVDIGFTSTVDVLGIVVTPNEVIVPVGSEVQLEALGLNDVRETMDLTDAVVWHSGSPSVATISNELAKEGILKGLMAGTTQVYADFDGVQSSPSKITVTEADLVRLSIAPPSVTVALNGSVQLSAEATFADGTSSNASGQVRWITADGSVATLSAGGLLEAKGIGNTEVKVEWVGVQSEAIEVTVVDVVSSSNVDLLFSGIYGGIDGGQVEVSIDVMNNGTDPAGEFWVDLFMDPTFEPAYGDWPDAFYMVDYLGAGESTVVTFTSPTTNDRHEFSVLLDSLETVAESNENNNLISSATDEYGGSGDPDPSGGRPNLRFDYVGGFSSDTETEYWVDVTNDGSVPADGFYIDVFFDRTLDEEPSIYDEGDAWHFQDGLGVGDTIYTSIVVDDTCFACGAWILLDGYDLNDESDESDNTTFFTLDSWTLPTSPADGE